VIEKTLWGRRHLHHDGAPSRKGPHCCEPSAGNRALGGLHRRYRVPLVATGVCKITEDPLRLRRDEIASTTWGAHMFRSAVYCLAIWLAASGAGLAAGMTFERDAASGQPKAVWIYRSWTPTCQETGGVTKVVTRPQHGKLSNRRVIEPVRSNRYNPRDPCIGKIIPGLQVIYTSAPGYRGTDKFVIERSLANGLVDVDTFIMTVR
jgi:hypothetical protein